MKKYFSLLIFVPFLAFAKAPDLLTLTLELGFLLVLIISLVKFSIPIAQKSLVFAAYIIVGILTKSIIIPIILSVAMLVYFLKKNDSNNK